MAGLLKRAGVVVPLAWIAVALALPWASFGADSGIAGRVLDPHGRSVAVATIRLKIGTLNATAVSDEQGQFRLTSVSPGPYRLTVEAKGFQPSGQDVTIPANGTVRLDVTLSGIAGQHQSIVISGKTQCSPLRSKCRSDAGRVAWMERIVPHESDQPLSA
jgi:hypothetical protein